MLRLNSQLISGYVNWVHVGPFTEYRSAQGPYQWQHSSASGILSTCTLHHGKCKKVKPPHESILSILQTRSNYQTSDYSRCPPFTTIVTRKLQICQLYKIISNSMHRRGKYHKTVTATGTPFVEANLIRHKHIRM